MGPTHHDFSSASGLTGLASDACRAGRAFYTCRAGQGVAWSACRSDFTSRTHGTGGASRTGWTSHISLGRLSTGLDRLRGPTPHAKERGGRHQH